MNQHSETVKIPGKVNQQDRLSGLDPVINPACRVLIVGSFPSSISLIHRQYYANPRNDFWKIMEQVLNLPPDLSYDDRIIWLLKKKVGLWDVVQSCTRPGSADTAIRDPQPSPIADLLIRYPKIRCILCNGRKAEAGLSAALQTPVSSPHRPVVTRYVPSTSPAHTIRFEEKCNAWMILREYLVDSLSG